MNAPITAAHRQLALQISTTPSCNPIAPDGQEACAQLIANFTAGQTETIAQLRAALELGQENCDAVYEDLRKERDEARSEWQAQAQLVKSSVAREAESANGLAMAAKVIQAGDNERRKLCEELTTVRSENEQIKAALENAVPIVCWFGASATLKINGSTVMVPRERINAYWKARAAISAARQPAPQEDAK